jgi:bifunctional non-homologous end joining protein LigD
VQTLPGSVEAVEPKVEFAMQTPDGAWRVEAVKRGSARWYRIVHGEEVQDRLSIASVERILDEADVDRSTLKVPAA